MGLCVSQDGIPVDDAALKDEKAKSGQVDALLTNAYATEQHVHKLLLLGAGESGKSTLFKQMVTIYGRGFTDEELDTFIPIICTNTIMYMKVLLQHVERYGGSTPFNSGALSSHRSMIESLAGNERIDSTIAESLHALWSDPAIKHTYQSRAAFQLPDSAAYFLDRIRVIGTQPYRPSFQDILHARVRTTGIVESEFTIKDNKFKMFDVGGQRNERKKWIHCFEGVTAVLFVAALSEYDQALYEDENINRMNEALNLFEDICNNRWFRKTAMILFLNKKDLFEEKLRTSPIDRSFPEYAGDSSYESGVKFFRNQFESRNRNDDKEIFTHVTCATDTDQMKHIFEDVKNIVVKQSLVDAGLY